MLSSKPERPSRALALMGDGEHDIEAIQTAIQQHGGPLMVDLPF